LKSDESGVEVINRSSAPEFMSNIEIDTISYSDEGDVLLSGRAQSKAASVRVYLDNRVITTLSVDTSGRWRGDLPDVDTGVYTLRVDEVDVQGDVTSRVETPFKREAPELLEAAAGESGAAVTAITVQTGATLWAIARDRYGDGTLFVRVFEANSETIKDPDLIYPGQVFDLPD
jgi:LysM repeat protein